MIKTPPHNIDAEQSVLGSILLDSRAAARAAGMLDPSDFYIKKHQLILTAAMSVQQAGDTVDIVTVMNYLQAHNELEEAGGPAYLSQLTSFPPSLAGFSSYCKIVKEYASKRWLLSLGAELAEMSLSAEMDSTEVIDHVSSNIISLSGRIRVGNEPVSIDSMTDELFDSVVKNTERDDISGVPTGLIDLDNRTWGWQPSDLIILAARPAQGKTTMALSFAIAAAAAKVRTLFVSLEMSKKQLAMKILSNSSGVNLNNLNRGIISDSMWPKITNGIGKMKYFGQYVIIDDSPGLSSTHLRNKVKLLAMKKEVGLIIVDYIQLMSDKGENRTQQIGAISRGLKLLAKELNVPVIALSQLNRGVEARNDKRPQMHDLRESGSIEQDADIIAFLYRDEYYNKDSPFKGITEINIAKFRNGEPGLISAAFDPGTSTYKSISKQEEDRR